MNKSSRRDGYELYDDPGTPVHPFHGESQPEPTYDSYPGHIVLELPGLCDEAAMQFSEMLDEICEQFKAHYADQIRSAARRYQLEQNRREYERLFRERQMTLPMFDGEPEF